MYQEGIYAPDGDTRWMGSMAMDDNGSIGICYIKSNATNIYPGIYYTGRRTCDPLGTLPVTETLIAAGTGSQTGINRVGDYSQTTLDPDGVTFWSIWVELRAQVLREQEYFPIRCRAVLRLPV
jgi:hypothetical protein